jgi:hypothetical protein
LALSRGGDAPRLPRKDPSPVRGQSHSDR